MLAMLRGSSYASGHLRRGLPRVVLHAGLWCILTAGEPASWVVGIPAVLAATLVSLTLPPPLPWRWHLRGMGTFLVFFLWRSVISGIDVAWRALHPRLPLAPLLLDYPLRLPPGPGRIFFANTVSLLPGTLSAELRNESVTIHVLNADRSVVRDLETLEVVIAGLFGLPLSPGVDAQETIHA